MATMVRNKATKKKKNPKRDKKADMPDGIPPIEDAKEDLQNIELRLRKYVKRSGGYRKELSEDDKREARRLLDLLGRKKLSWDVDLVPVP